MKLVQASSRARIVFYPKTASNAQAEGDLLFLTSGKLSKCASAANAAVIAGIAMKPVVSTDSDYAGTTKIPVLVDEDAIWSIPVTTATSFGIGVTCDTHTDGQTLVCNASTYDPFVIVGGDTTTAHVKIRRWATADTQAIA